MSFSGKCECSSPSNTIECMVCVAVSREWQGSPCHTNTFRLLNDHAICQSQTVGQFLFYQHGTVHLLHKAFHVLMPTPMEGVYTHFVCRIKQTGCPADQPVSRYLQQRLLVGFNGINSTTACVSLERGSPKQDQANEPYDIQYSCHLGSLS